jgi:UDP-glucose 4-epimerase
MSVIFVTGAAGYIGSHVVLNLLDQGYDVVGLDDLSNSYMPEQRKGYTFYEGDAGDEMFLKSILRQHEDITACIHLAGSIYVAESVEMPTFYYHNNVYKSYLLFKTCAEHGIKNFVFSSSASVYGESAEKEINESHSLMPISPYGRTKLLGELVLQDLAQDFDINFMILRYFNVCGADEKLRAGQNNKQSRHLIHKLCRVVQGVEDKFCVMGTDYDTPDGTCVRDYIHVSDLAAVHRVSVEHIVNGKSSAILNCGYGKGYSVQEIVDAMKKATGSDFPVENHGRRDKDVAYLVASNKALHSTLDWSPEYDDIDIILRTAWDWEKKRLSKLP